MSKTKRDRLDQRTGIGDNVHHLQNKTNGGTSTAANLKKIQIKVHKEIHDLFGNNNPFEMMEMISKFGRQIFTDEFINASNEFFDERRNKAIKKSCYNQRNSYNRGQQGALNSYT